MKIIKLNQNKIIAKHEAREIRANIKQAKKDKMYDIRFNTRAGISFIIYSSGTLVIYGRDMDEIRITKREKKVDVIKRHIDTLEKSKTKFDIAWALDSSYYIIHHAHSHEHLYVNDRLKNDFLVLKEKRLNFLKNLLKNKGEKLVIGNSDGTTIYYYKDVKIIHNPKHEYIIIKTPHVMDKRVKAGRLLYLIVANGIYSNMAKNAYLFYSKGA